MEKLLGIDVGSTTVKTAVLDQETGNVLYTSYQRHFSRVKECVVAELEKIENLFPGEKYKAAVTGSAGLGIATASKLPFVQEVQASFLAVHEYYPDADVVVELGGEDAKIIFLTGGMEQRMNGSCAGGTGSFIDQMATLLDLDVSQMDALALQAEKTYPIASRCGVFAKSDIQPLLNQGAAKADIAASIFHAVVEQTVAGLAQGRKIKGKVLFLGGPLHFYKALQKAFVQTLDLSGEYAVFPENAPVFMALGSALYAAKENAYTLSEMLEKIKNGRGRDEVTRGQPLFESQEEYDEFVERHKQSDLKFADIHTYTGEAYLGIDSGSTTTKLLLITPDCEILYAHYQTNNGQPLDVVVEKVKEIYALCENRITIRAGAVTGYGEDMIKAALKLDFGLVETVAHFKAALYFNPKVDFIIDIGGQDIKCFKVKNNAIDSIMLNEACSSGCGSFIQTFAKAMNYNVEEFSRLGLFAQKPVELGSRCTVFMNSAVKQAQKEGATVEDISAGISSSVVKNALYKVIRARSAEEIGENIVVQGGTFMNDAVLRSFEKETGKHVVRPAIAGLMGAFGAAIYAKERQTREKSTMLSKAALGEFSYTAKGVVCRGCTSHCNVNVLTFANGEKYVSGNKCERGAGGKKSADDWNIYEYKYHLLRSLETGNGAGRYATNVQKPLGRVGLALGLVTFEQMPLWTAFFRELGLETVMSDESSRALYYLGQHTVASDTVCYPAKLMHGHIESLLDKNVDFIFYPCESYNLDERAGINHYNCPVVAYYAELLKANNERLTEENFLSPYLDLNNLALSAKTLKKTLSRYRFTEKQIKEALEKGLHALEDYQKAVRRKGREILSGARMAGKTAVVLLGRPYHADPEINHGVGKLLTSLGVAVLSEDSVASSAPVVETNVLNQWTYHARLYRAAEFVCKHKDTQLVQLVSFGCGLDAVTSDEVREIMERNNKLYTQIKIDEINNLGVVKIRLRSLLATVKGSKEEK
ncbi:MAG: 2-hydroxyacyl-CoA dehydratase [Clostridia bacterium]|nr:2-hydroxyacyl-CoA dehydratase [Clostridia bacterium]